MMSLTFGLFTQVSDAGLYDPLVLNYPEKIDLSYKMCLAFWDCFRREKPRGPLRLLYGIDLRLKFYDPTYS